MPTAKPKRKTTRKSTSRTRKAASSPIPCGPGGCGHEGTCGPDGCNVRYVGPVSHLRDHHAWHAARGSTHVWAAAVTTGVALVLTAAIAYTTIDAKNVARAESSDEQVATTEDVERIIQRLDKLERAQTDLEVTIHNQMKEPTQQEIFDSTLPSEEE